MKNFFKKALVILFTGVAAASMVACGGKTNAPTNQPVDPTPQPTPTPDPTPAPVDGAITVAKALEIAGALEPKAQTSEKYIVTGVISRLKENFNAEYGNASFYIKDAAGEAEFLVFRAFVDSAKTKFTAETFAENIVIGKTVTLEGTIKNFLEENNTSTLELTNCYLYTPGSVKPDPDPTPDPEPVDGAISVAKALEIAGALEPKAETSEKYIVTGVVSRLKEEFNDKYGNATFYIKDANGNSEFLVFRALADSTGTKFTAETFAENIAVGKTVTLEGKIKNYAEKDGSSTLELSNCYLYTSGPVTPDPTPTPQPVVKDAKVTTKGSKQNISGEGTSLSSILNLPAQVASAVISKPADDFQNKQGDVYAAATDFRIYKNAQLTFVLAEGYTIKEVKVEYYVAKTNPKKGTVSIQIAEDGKSFVVVASDSTVAVSSFELIFA